MKNYDDRCAPPSDEDAVELTKIEVDFAIPVFLTQAHQRRLLDLLPRSCDESDEKPDNMVNHPPHYNTGKFEVIDVIEDWRLGFHEGNVVKYVARAEHKGKQLEDLKKARWYLNRRIEQLEEENDGEESAAT